MEDPSSPVSSTEAALPAHRIASIISHDLRTPLLGIRWLAEVLLEEDGASIPGLPNSPALESSSSAASSGDGASPSDPAADPANRRRYRLIHQSAQQALDLLENVLTWARLQTDDAEEGTGRYNLSELVKSNLRLLGSIAHKKGVTVVNDVPPALSVAADYHAVHTILRNLISNAIKFTEADGTVTVQCAEGPDPETVQITVVDTGIGIPADVQERLFQENRTATRRGTDGEVGTGLGLALCREMVERCGGRLWIESTEGEGTAAHFTLPRAVPAEQDA